jgi:hypothetical protein
MPTASGQTTVLRFAAAESHVEDELASSEEPWTSGKEARSAAQVSAVELNGIVSTGGPPLSV